MFCDSIVWSCESQIKPALTYTLLRIFYEIQAAKNRALDFLFFLFLISFYWALMTTWSTESVWITLLLHWDPFPKTRWWGYWWWRLFSASSRKSTWVQIHSIMQHGNNVILLWITYPRVRYPKREWLKYNFDLCLMKWLSQIHQKWPSNILQNLLWFWNIKTELVFLFILFYAAMSTRLGHSLGLGGKI